MYHCPIATVSQPCWNLEFPMPVSLDISPAAGGDHEWCARLMASSEPWITLGRDLRGCDVALRVPGRELFVARDRGRQVGFILMAPYGFAASPYIATLAVASDDRSRGVGAALLEFAEHHFAGRKHLFLLCSSFNKRGQKFYRAHGYYFVGELKGYVVPQHDEYIFMKRISSDEIIR